MINFEYEPLDRNTEGLVIRLLEVCPGTGPLQCRLQHVLLSDKPRYEALSYCWGDSSRLKSITVNGNPISVTINLYEALNELRRPEESRLLWVDAVCINQRDIEERNDQVRSMREIYQRCTQVVVWLGREDKHTELAIKMLQIMAEWSKDVSEAAQHSQLTEFYLRRLASDPRTAGLSEVRIDEALSSIFTRPYFSRVWIIQELTVAPSAIVRCGKYEIPWDIVDSASRSAGEEFGSGSEALIQMRREFRQGNQYKFPIIIVRQLECQATDPRDKIFALVGLANDAADYTSVDYNEDVRRVFVQFTSAVLERASNLDILSLCWGGRSDKGSDVPSWVFRWGWDPKKDTSISHSMVWFKAEQGIMFSAARDSIPSVLIDQSNGILTLEGFHVDTVVDVCDAHLNLAITLEGINADVSYWQLWKGRLEYMICYDEWQIFISHWISQTSDTPYSDHEDVFWRVCSCLSPFIAATPNAVKQRFERFNKLLQLFRRIRMVFGFESIILDHFAFLIIFIACLLNSDLYQLSMDFETDVCACYNRGLFRTKSGYVGLGPLGLTAGDSIALLKGAKVPYALRKSSDLDWQLVGETYLYGAMNGKIWDESKCTSLMIR